MTSINRSIATSIMAAFFAKDENENIVLFDYVLDFVSDDDLDTMVRNMRDPHIPLYVFESYKVLDNDDIQFTVRVINIGCLPYEIVIASGSEE